MDDLIIVPAASSAQPDPTASRTEGMGDANTTLPGSGDMNNEHSSTHGLDFDYRDLLYYTFAMVGLIVFFVWTRSRVPAREFRRWERRREELRQQEARTERMSDPAYRVNLVLRGIVIKNIVREKAGQLLLGDYNGEPAGEEDDHLSCSSGNLSIDSMDENANTCVICLEMFRVGDTVAWSERLLAENTDQVCNHVFHKDCILPWLMHPMHDDCPYCRRPIVHEESNSEAHQCWPVMEQDRTPHMSSAFVIMRGLVSRVRQARTTLIGQSGHGRHSRERNEGEPRRNSAPPTILHQSLIMDHDEEQGAAKFSHDTQSLRRRSSVGSATIHAASSSSASLPHNLAPVGVSSSPPVVMRKTISDVGGALRPGLTALLLAENRTNDSTTLTLPYPTQLGIPPVHTCNYSEFEDLSETTIEEEDDLFVADCNHPPPERHSVDSMTLEDIPPTKNSTQVEDSPRVYV